MPDPSQWADDLAARLATLSADYATLRGLAEGSIHGEDGEDVDPVHAQVAATACAAQALQAIMLALDTLPALAGAFRAGPLRDLIGALDDLRRGQNPALLRPAPQGAGGLSVRLEMLKARAAASVLVMKRSGASDAAARRDVARIFTEAGHRGKKGGPVSATTLWGWCLDCAPDPAGNIHQREMAAMAAKLPEAIPRTRALQLVRREAAKQL